MQYWGILLSNETGTMDTLEATKESVVETAAEVTKEVSRFQQYINDHIPDVISFGMRMVLAIIVFIIGKKLIDLIRKIVRRSLEKSTVDKGVEQFTDSLLKCVLYFILIISLVKQFGVDTTSLAALLASGGVALGLALQGSLSNFAGGVLILLLKPFVVGDYIIEDAHGNEGTVKEIQIFYTKLATIDNKTIVIPNGSLSNTSLTNVTAKDERRLDIIVGIAYDSDLKKAKQLIETILREDEKILQEEQIVVYVDNLGESSVDIGLRAWVRTDEYWTTRWRVLEEIKLTFDREGIEIPFPQVTVHQGK